ncbi:hypothetical protein AB0B45_13900 [Nonomuraea sp. NPDC049152]|uniref:hypothetical protein n=1 Tax=Nonomuraea sp. NPDC049152 TaxID=3154350 RepID=UPI0033E7DF13
MTTVEFGVPIDSRTRFDIVSISKQFTAACLPLARDGPATTSATTAQVELEGDAIVVPEGPGIGVAPSPEALEVFTVGRPVCVT